MLSGRPQAGPLECVVQVSRWRGRCALGGSLPPDRLDRPCSPARRRRLLDRPCDLDQHSADLDRGQVARRPLVTPPDAEPRQPA
jgi:hypothetical protein